MSTEIKPGQIWADKNGARLRVDLVRPAHVEFTWLGGIMHVLRTEEFLAAFELVEDVTTPLDPSKVKAGDTVTVRFAQTGDEFTTTAYCPEDIKQSGHVYILGWPLNKPGGLHGLAVKHFELLDHQPASEPEPEWKPGMVAVITPSMPGGNIVRSIRGHEGNWVNEFHGSWDDDEVAHVRPLIVIDPAEVDLDKLVEAYQFAYTDTDGHGYDGHHRRRMAMEHALATIGIEVAR